jgi:hypothetical protein
MIDFTYINKSSAKAIVNNLQERETVPAGDSGMEVIRYSYIDPAQPVSFVFDKQVRVTYTYFTDDTFQTLMTRTVDTDEISGFIESVFVIDVPNN